MLAESWEHPQPERWRFRLRKNVRFHDGSPLTAEIVRAAIEGVRHAPAEAEASQFLNDVRDVVVVDAGTVDIVTQGPRALLANLSFLHVTKPNAAGALPTPSGTGPYRLKERKEGEYVSMERWDDYWGPRPEFGFAAFQLVASPEERLERIESRDADIAYSIPPELAAVPRPGVRIARGAGLTVMYLGFGMAQRPDNPFTDRRVRKAFHLAIDRGELLRRVLHGTGAVPTQPIAPRVFGFNPGLAAPPYDPAQSRRLLTDGRPCQGTARAARLSEGTRSGRTAAAGAARARGGIGRARRARPRGVVGAGQPQLAVRGRLGLLDRRVQRVLPVLPAHAP